MKKEKIFILGLGGSVVFPQKVNSPFLKRFYFFIKKQIKRGKKFIIVVGGGRLAREFQASLDKISKYSNFQKDWLGIYATRLNAYLLKTIFKDYCHHQIFDERFKIRDFGRKKIIIACGWRPGFSTDFVACQIAKDFKQRRVILLSNINYIYNKDPKKHKDVKPIKKITWNDYLKIIPSQWRPGLHAPVDPSASRFCKKHKIEVILTNAYNLLNLKRILEGKKFKGSIIF